MQDLLEAFFYQSSRINRCELLLKVGVQTQVGCPETKIGLMSELAVVPTLIYRQPVPLIIISFQNLLILVLFHPSRHIS